jgi:hypothetical protein
LILLIALAFRSSRKYGNSRIIRNAQAYTVKSCCATDSEISAPTNPKIFTFKR